MADGGGPHPPPLFAPGDVVRTRADDPAGHTRLPRYARGQRGRVVEVAGDWPLADDVAGGAGRPRVEPVYVVAFEAVDLWGEGTHEVTVELWQSYLRAEHPEQHPEQRDRPAQPGLRPGVGGGPSECQKRTEVQE